MARNRQLLKAGNSVMVTRRRLSGRKEKDRKVFTEDLKGLTFEFANFILLKKGISPDKLKERLPALYDSVVMRHPLYADICEQYIAHNDKPQNENVLEENLASSQPDNVQRGIATLTQILIDAEEQYRASVNTVQQVASDVLSANIRAVKRAGVVIRRHAADKTHVANKPLRAALKKHNHYLTTLSETETLVQGCIDRITEAKDGREGYSDSCNILINAFKQSMKQSRNAAPAEGIVKTEARASFIERLQSKFSAQKITEALVVSFLPDIYEAIDLDISDTQMQAAVDLAEHYIRLSNEYTQAASAFNRLPLGMIQSLAQVGVKLQSPYDYVMAVACDPMQMMAHYFSDQWRDYLQSRPLTKKLVSALTNVAYGVAGVATYSFDSVVGYSFAQSGAYFSTLSPVAFTKKPRLTESAYISAMAFHGFLVNLGVERASDKTEADVNLENNNKQALFNHYFQGRDADGRQALTFETYLANEAVFSRIRACYGENGRVVPGLDRPEQHDFLAVIARVGYFQNALARGALSLDDIQAMVVEFNDYCVRFSGKPLHQQYLSPMLFLMTPFLYERLLVPVISRLIDEGVVGKEHKDYLYLGELLKALRKKTLISQRNVSDVLALLQVDERDRLEPILMQMFPWQQKDAVAIHVTKPESSPSVMTQSIKTDNRVFKQNIINTLDLVQPKLMLESVVLHLESHIAKCQQLGLPVELQDINQAKLNYCVAVKGILEGILKHNAFSDNKTLAGYLVSINLALPAIPSPSKGEVVKLLVRVADEFGPVTSGSEDKTPLVKRVMNFVISLIDNEALSGVYETLNKIKDNRDQLSRGEDTDDLTAVWFEDESVDPFDMDSQGGHIVRLVMKRYMNDLMNPIYDTSGIEAVIKYFKRVPGYEFVAEKLSYYMSRVLAKDLSKEKVIEFVCQCIGIQAHTKLHEEPYAVRLSHVFFKVMAMRGDDLAQKIAFTGLVSEPQAKNDIEALQQWAQAFSFKPSAAPSIIAETIFAVEGDDPLREIKLQLLLTHCDYLKTYAMGLENGETRSAILLSVIDALKVCQTPAARAEQLTTYQSNRVFHLFDACKEMSQRAITQATETVKTKVDTLSADVKRTNDGMIRRINRKRTVLNIIFQIGYYVIDVGLLPYAAFSLVKFFMSLVTAVKALTSLTLSGVVSAAGVLVAANPIGWAIIAARFAFGLAWQAFQCRKAFRKDWKASASVLGKVGVIAKYTGIVLGKALLSTLVSTALVDTVIGFAKKVIGIIPVVGLIKEKLSARAKQLEFEGVMNAFGVLRDTVNDASFDEQVIALKDKLTSLKYKTDKADAWKQELDSIVNKRREVRRLASMLPSTDGQVMRVLQANPPKALPAPELQVKDWVEFVEARKVGGRGVIRYFCEQANPEQLEAGLPSKKRAKLENVSFDQPSATELTQETAVRLG